MTNAWWLEAEQGRARAEQIPRRPAHTQWLWQDEQGREYDKVEREEATDDTEGN